MKKTIAILLVLVIGMVGVWAATNDGDDSTLQITTSVSQLTGFKVTKTAKSTNSYADFSLMETADILAIDETGSFGLDGNDAAITAYITAANNAVADFTIGVSATAMTGETSGNNSVINYKVYIAGSEKWDTAAPATDPVDVLTVNGTASTGMVVASSAITISVNSVDYNNAAVDTYVGLITFEITSN